MSIWDIFNYFRGMLGIHAGIFEGATVLNMATLFAVDFFFYFMFLFCYSWDFSVVFPETDPGQASRGLFGKTLVSSEITHISSTSAVFCEVHMGSTALLSLTLVAFSIHVREKENPTPHCKHTDRIKCTKQTWTDGWKREKNISTLFFKFGSIFKFVIKCLEYIFLSTK